MAVPGLRWSSLKDVFPDREWPRRGSGRNGALIIIHRSSAPPSRPKYPRLLFPRPQMNAALDAEKHGKEQSFTHTPATCMRTRIAATRACDAAFIFNVCLLVFAAPCARVRTRHSEHAHQPIAGAAGSVVTQRRARGDFDHVKHSQRPDLASERSARFSLVNFLSHHSLALTNTLCLIYASTLAVLTAPHADGPELAAERIRALVVARAAAHGHRAGAGGLWVPVAARRRARRGGLVL